MLICFPHKPASGGPGSFQIRLESELSKRGWNLCYAGQCSQIPDVILVVGGTRRLLWLLRMKLSGVPVVYRLDGLAWIHRKLKVCAKKWIQNETRNILGKMIHAFLADRIVYQSEFVQKWWERKGWRLHVKSDVIYNGVDLSIFDQNINLTSNSICSPNLVCIEGTIDYSPFAVELLNTIAKLVSGKNMRLIVYGKFEDASQQQNLSSLVEYRGMIGREQVPSAFKDCIYLSLDVHPACPNTVAEALASGVPVLAFDTGSLKELVEPGGGEVVPYGADAWRLEPPSIDNLMIGLDRILADYPRYSRQARAIAEARYDIAQVTNAYLAVFEKACKGK